MSGNNSASDPTTVVATADLSVTKTSSPNPYTDGSPLTYTIVVTNNGPSDVGGAVVADTLPPSLSAPTWTCVVAPGDGACGATSGSGNIATTVDLKSATSATFTVNGTVAAGTLGVISNTTTITPPLGVTDPAPGNNSATDTNPTVPIVDLAVTKTSTPDPYVAGTPLAYTVTVTNHGPADVAGAVFADTVPAQLTGVSWTCSVIGTGTCSSSTGSGNGISATLDLVNGAVATVAISGTVLSGTVGSISNTASVSAPSGAIDPSPGNNSATNDNPAGSVQADPQIGLSPVSSSGSAGSHATITVDVTNNGPDAAQNVQAVITVPPAFSIGTATGPGWSCSVALNLVTCDFAGPLGATAVAPPITLQLTLPGAAGGYTLAATVSSATPDTNNANNAANAAVTVNVPQPPTPPRADLSITKTTSSAAAASGDQISFVLAVHNDGPDPAADVAITDALSDGLTLVSVAGDGWACSNVGSTITCIRAQLASGATATVTLVVTAARGGTITNSAGVTSSTGDPNAANNASSTTLPVAGRVDLAVSKSVSAPTFVPGKPLAFTIVVRNTGPDDVVGAQIRDLVPAALNGFEWTCSAVLGQCTDLAGSGSIVQTVDIRAGGRVAYRLAGVAPQDVAAIENRVTVSAPSGVVDADASNNAAAARARHGLVPTQLRVTVSPAVATVASGVSTRFAIRTTNTGTSTATAVVTCVTIPAGASVAEATGGVVANGRYCWHEAALLPGKTAQYVISVRGDRRQAQHLALVASAAARNAPATFAKARLNVLAMVEKMTGGYTG